MLPRLRFVIAAIVIAILPIAFVGTGFVTSAHNNSAVEFPRTNQARGLAAPEGQDARQLQALAYARRAGELERLRDLANAPLSTWLAAPAGDRHDRQSAVPACVMPDWQAAAIVQIAKLENVVDGFVANERVLIVATEREPESLLSLQMKIAALSGALPRIDASVRDLWTIAGNATLEMRAKAQLRAKLIQRRRARAFARARPHLQYTRPSQPDFGPLGWLFGEASKTKFSAAQPLQRTF